MGKKLYIGNLSYKLDEAEVENLFSKVGKVESVRIIKDPATGRSKGFGFVEMGSDEEAEKAITQLNGSTLMDRTLIVSEAKPREAGARRERSGSGSSWR